MSPLSLTNLPWPPLQDKPLGQHCRTFSPQPSLSPHPPLPSSPEPVLPRKQPVLEHQPARHPLTSGPSIRCRMDVEAPSFSSARKLVPHAAEERGSRSRLAVLMSQGANIQGLSWAQQDR